MMPNNQPATEAGLTANSWRHGITGVLTAVVILAGAAWMAAAGAPVWPFHSPAIQPGQPIPARFSCQGEDISPPLSWSAPPAAARSLALIVRDRTADNFTHWLIWNLPPTTRALAAGVPAGAKAAGGIQGTNSFGRLGYSGPCPPPGDGPHQYVFTLFALDARLALRAGASREELLAAMRNHVVTSTDFRGTFQR